MEKGRARATPKERENEKEKENPRARVNTSLREKDLVKVDGPVPKAKPKA
jgi:hypothetical protein